MRPLYLSVHLPSLPLNALRPCWSDPGPCVVMHDGRALVVSAAARALGVRPGMRAGGILAIAPQTVLLERAPLREEAALQALVLALYQFTPDIARDDGGLLLDVGASLRLFGGPARLTHRVRACLAQLGVQAAIGAAPTAGGAWLLARCPRMAGQVLSRRCVQLPRLQRLLDAAPCGVLPATHPYRDWLDGIGAQTLGALRRLPRAGLTRRTSTQLLDVLDRAYGDETELFRWLTIPASFCAQIDTHERVEHADALLDGARYLVLQMTGWLRAVHLAVQSFTLQLQHERGRTAIVPTPIDITLAEAAWQPEHLVRLLRERLAKTILCAPVIGLCLEAGQLIPLEPGTASLFPEPAGGAPGDLARFMELLTARLGADNVLAPAPVADHRPEVCNTWRPATLKRRQASDDAAEATRPFWVLRQPIRLLMRDDRPYYGSPLCLIAGPERIEAGWWAGDTAARDYYVAQGREAACYWVYQERGGDMAWYLHGLFA